MHRSWSSAFVETPQDGRQRVLKELRRRLYLHQQLPSASSIDAMLDGELHIKPIQQKKEGGPGELSVLVGGLWHKVFPKFFCCILWDEGHSIERKVCVYGKSARQGGVHCRAFLTCPRKCKHRAHCREAHLLSLARQFLRTTYTLPAETSVPKPVGFQVLADEMPEVNAPVHRWQMDQHVEAENHAASDEIQGA